MKANNSVRNIMVVCIMLNLLALGACGFIVYTIKTKSEAVSNLSLSLREAEVRTERFDEIRGRIGGIEVKASNLESHIPSETKIVDFLKLIERIANEQGLIIKTEIRQNGADQKAANGIDLTFTYTYSGNFKGIQNFVALIEELPYIVVVQSVNLKKDETVLPSGVPGWSGAITFNIKTS